MNSVMYLRVSMLLMTTPVATRQGTDVGKTISLRRSSYTNNIEFLACPVLLLVNLVWRSL